MRKISDIRRKLFLESLEHREVPATLYVAPTGVDAVGRGTQDAPFQHIQYAVNVAATDDFIKVAGGTYTYDAALDTNAAQNGASAVITYINKRLTFQGGYSVANWTTPDTTANPTVIDGGNAVRGVLVVGLAASAPGTTGIVLENFTVQNGLGGRNPQQSSNSFIYGEGGGVVLNFGGEQGSSFVNKIRNVIIQNNVAQGADTTSPVGGKSFNYGGFGVGGGLFATFVGQLQLEQVTVRDNKAIGGNGTLMAGAALGGGVWLDTTNTLATDVTITGNQAIGGNTAGPNASVDGRFPEVLGGGIMVRADPSNPNKSNALFSRFTVANNAAVGGNSTSTAANSIGSDAAGGGFVSEYSNLSFADSQFDFNTSTAGSGFKGGTGVGGGIRTFNDKLTMTRTEVIGNTATSGSSNNLAGGGAFGPVGGGGLYLTNFNNSFSRAYTIANSLITDNQVLFPTGGGTAAVAAGGGGAGIWLQGPVATIDNTTIARNRTDDRLIFGMGVLLINAGAAGNTDVTLRNSIVSDHNSNSARATTAQVQTPAVTVFPDNVIRLQNTLFAANDKDNNNQPGIFGGVGTYADTNTRSAAGVGYISPGGPSYNYGLTATSPARNAATFGTPPADDLYNHTRTAIDGTPDLGAIEFGSTGTVGRVFAAISPSVPPPPPTPGQPQLVGYRQFAAGADAGGSGVTLYNAAGAAVGTVDPFPGFAGGVRTAAADFNNDGVADIVAGTGPGRATKVVILDGKTQAQLFTVDPFEASFTGGVYVTAGDVTGDGIPDLAVTPDEGGGPRVDLYNGSGFAKLRSFFGIDDPNFRGGARSAISDMNADGTGDLIVVAGFGGGPRVAGFDGKSLAGTPTKIFGDFFAFEQSLRNGIFVTAGDINGDGYSDLVAGGGPGGGPRVLAFDGRSLLTNQYANIANFFGGDANSRGGIRLAIKNLDGDSRADLVVGSGSGAGSRVTGYLGANIAAAGTPATAFDFNSFGSFTGGVFVG